MQFPIRLSKQHFEVPSAAISTLGLIYNVPSKKLSHLSQFVSRNGEVTELGSFKSEVPSLNYTITATCFFFFYEKSER